MKMQILPTCLIVLMFGILDYEIDYRYMKTMASLNLIIMHVNENNFKCDICVKIEGIYVFYIVLGVFYTITLGV